MQKRFSLMAAIAVLGFVACLPLLAFSTGKPGSEGEPTHPNSGLPVVTATQWQEGWHDRVAVPCGKIDPEAAGNCSCEPVESAKSNDLGLDAELSPANKGNGRGGRVAAMVGKALEDQAVILTARLADLQRWDRQDQAHFARWFGTTDERARVLIVERIGVLLKLNEMYSVREFRRAIPSRPGVFAFVYANDPSKVFLDKAFVKAPPVGTNSRAGTITHEMSHFTIAGGTKDHAYGTEKCTALARTAPATALRNADNFEFYVEGAN